MCYLGFSQKRENDNFMFSLKWSNLSTKLSIQICSLFPYPVESEENMGYFFVWKFLESEEINPSIFASIIGNFTWFNQYSPRIPLHKRILEIS